MDTCRSRLAVYCPGLRPFREFDHLRTPWLLNIACSRRSHATGGCIPAAAAPLHCHGYLSWPAAPTTSFTGFSTPCSNELESGTPPACVSSGADLRPSAGQKRMYSVIWAPHRRKGWPDAPDICAAASHMQRATGVDYEPAQQTVSVNTLSLHAHRTGVESREHGVGAPPAAGNHTVQRSRPAAGSSSACWGMIVESPA